MVFSQEEESYRMKLKKFQIRELLERLEQGIKKEYGSEKFKYERLQIESRVRKGGYLGYDNVSLLLW